MVPFFYVAKGDSIPKGIFREKPKLISDTSVVVLFSTANDNGNKLKATGIIDNANFPFKDPITYLYVSIRDNNNVGDWLWDDLKKIPVDLNEGAGGKWIYLFYSRLKKLKIYKNLIYYPINFITVVEGRPGPYLDALPGSYLVQGPDDKPFPDLNDGAGGAYLYLIARDCITEEDRKRFGEPITDIMIVSANTSNINYTNWTKINIDLNKGAGGKYIYIFYRRAPKLQFILNE
ncbi:MAG: hypothetical protein N2662_09185 [Bacteroidales bacterium]|nr:hypothetical protein [Bacteroidales bacterium]